MHFIAVIIFDNDPFFLITALPGGARRAGFAAAWPPPRMPAALIIKEDVPAAAWNILFILTFV